MVKKRVTSRLVAKQAGVSQTTVSFVLNNVKGQNISSETIERVRKAAQELGYVPDVAAQTLARGFSHNIGLVLTQPHKQVFSDAHVPYLMTGITEVIREKGFRVLIELVHDVYESNTYEKLIRGKEVAGLIVLPYNPTPKDLESLKKLAEEQFPIVSLQPMDDSIHSVSLDDVSGTTTAIGHLIALGHRDIAAISYAPKDSNPYATSRIKAYCDMLLKNGIEVNQRLIRYGEYDPETGYRAARALMFLDTPPTAIFALNDVMAIGAMRAVQEGGLRIPQDIAVVGFDDIHLSQYLSPSLTTIQAPDIEQGSQAASMLLKLIANDSLDSRHIELVPQLVIRESCGYRLKLS